LAAVATTMSSDESLQKGSNLLNRNNLNKIKIKISKRERTTDRLDEESFSLLNPTDSCVGRGSSVV
jgi:hypothetical protein